MKLLFILIPIVFLLNQTCFVQGSGYEGYVFPENHFIMMTIKNQKARFTPSTIDVKKAEQLLKEQIESLNSDQKNQIGNCPIIHRNLKKYKRQYVGFLNLKGEKVIWINFIWSKDLESMLSEDIVSVQDGCSFFWNIKVNISEESVYELNVNGLG